MFTSQPDSPRQPQVRLASLRDDTRGAVVVMGVFMAVFLVGCLWYMMGVGEAAIYAQRMSAGADAVAFGSAVYHARGMNVMAMLNVIMAATLATLVAARSLHKVIETVVAYAIATCNQPPITKENGEVIDKPGAWACGIAEEAQVQLGIITDVIDKIESSGDGVMVGLSRGQRDIAKLTPWVAAAHSTGIGGPYAPIVTNSVSMSPAMSPTDERFGLPVQDEPFDTMCLMGQDLVDEVVLAALAPIMAQIPDMGSIISYDTIWMIVGTYPVAYCHGDGSDFDFNVIDTENVCHETLQTNGCDPNVGTCSDPPPGGDDDDDDDDDDDEDDGPNSEEQCEEGTQDEYHDPKSKPGQAFKDWMESWKKKQELMDPEKKQGVRIYEAAVNGSDYFAVYGVVGGSKTFLERSDDGVAVAAWGSSSPSGYPGDAIKLAQAEYYYDQTPETAASDRCCDLSKVPLCQANGPCGITWPSYRWNVMWNMRWRARLRRLHEPQDVDVNVLTGGVTPGVDISSHYVPGEIDFANGLANSGVLTNQINSDFWLSVLGGG